MESTIPHCRHKQAFIGVVEECYSEDLLFVHFRFSGAKPSRLGGGNLPRGFPRPAGCSRLEHLEVVEVWDLPRAVSVP